MIYFLYMDAVYSLNNHPISGMPMKPAEHKKTMGGILVIIVIIAVVAAISYWMGSSRAPATAPVSASSQQDKVRAQVAALLQAAPAHASQAEIDNVASLLQKTKAKPSDATRKLVASQLEL